MQKRAFAFETKALDEDAGTFEGYASIFGNKDQGGDIVEPGAFAKTIAQKGGKFPLLADHDWSLSGRLGYVEAKEDETGLWVKGFFNMAKERAREVYSDIKQVIEAGMEMGMSFGYDIERSNYDKKTSTLHLQELKVYETTVTQFPMNQSAGITTVKDIAGMSRPEILQLIEDLKGLVAPPPDEAEIIRALTELRTSIQP